MKQVLIVTLAVSILAPVSFAQEKKAGIRGDPKAIAEAEPWWKPWED
jgi:hypothetical protein